jgi:hypothetical protein
MLQNLAIIPVFLLIGSSLIILVSSSWRRSILALTVQYLGVFWLVAISWPLGLAVVKLVVGCVAGTILGGSQITDYSDEQLSGFSGRFLRILAAIFVFILIYMTAPAISDWLPVRIEILWGGLILIGMGLLQLGMTTHPLRVVLGLLSVFSGFETIYAAMEASVLLTGLLAIVTLGLALVGSYLLNISRNEEIG